MTTETDPSAVQAPAETATLVANVLARTATTSSEPPNHEPPGRRNALPPTSREWRASNLGLDESNPKIATLAECCERFVRSCLRDIRDRGTWFVVSGQTGCGKTHCAEAIRRYYDTRRISCWSMGWLGTATHVPAPIFAHWPAICELNDIAFAEWFEDVGPARLVIIDDFGAESERYRNGANDSRLLRVLEACDPRHGKWFFGTTNIPRFEWTNRYDQRIADRLRSGAHIGLFDVPSYRLRTPR